MRYHALPTHPQISPKKSKRTCRDERAEGPCGIALSNACWKQIQPCALLGSSITGGEKGGKEIPEANSKMSKEETMKERAPRSTAKRGGYRPAYSRPRKAEGMIMRATFVLVPRREGRVWERRRVLYIFIFCGQVGAGCTRDLLAVDKFNSHSNSRDRRQQNRGNLTFQAFNFWSRDASRTRKARDPQ
ncbi:hypothetical protein MCOR24_006064 [Pyricularia oryzae]|nr:hypothetical protein MCOR24_006064 [Pyricularia oryzae]KAI6535549.1 hypothetical protein MCOR05_005940 [Pyricularia oryzae]